MGLSATAQDFWSQVLQTLGAPATPLNVGELASWSSKEGTSAAWNPLATEKGEPGSWQFNSAGVQNYPTEAAGVAATAATLEGGYYSPIVADLRASVPFGPETQQAFYDWSRGPNATAGGYGSPGNSPGYTSPALGGSPSSAPSGSGVSVTSSPAPASSSGSSPAPSDTAGALGQTLGQNAAGGLSKLLDSLVGWFTASGAGSARLIGFAVAAVVLYMGWASTTSEGPARAL